MNKEHREFMRHIVRKLREKYGASKIDLESLTDDELIDQYEYWTLLDEDYSI